MRIRKLETLKQQFVENPGTHVALEKIVFRGHECYVVCHVHNDHSFYLHGSYFVCKGIATQWFEHMVRMTDLSVELTKAEEADIATFCTRNYHEMVAYLER